MKNSKMQMTMFLILIAVSAILSEKQLLPLQMIGLAVLTAVGADMVFVRLRKIEPFLPSAAIVSGLIIGLLSAPALPWYYTVTAAVTAMAGKNFLRYGNRHIFNPAAAGLFIVGLLFNNPISWWGVSFQTLRLINPVSFLFFLILLSPGYVSMIRMRRYKILLGFAAVYVLLGGTVFDPTTLFFSLVMLPEPMTTPSSSSRQLLFGALVAAIAVLTGFIHSVFTPFTLDPLITGLLAGNLLAFVMYFL